jgi:small subunit ribosomal protein S8
MNIQIIRLLNNLKNSSLANKEFISMEYNTDCVGVLKILYREGFVLSYRINKSENKIFIFLRYSFNKPIFDNLKIISTPSKKTYLNYHEISKIPSRKNVFFFSTNKGMLTDLECKRYKIGGTLFFIC